MVTIRQVADEAGVSIGTVSRVLNNKPGVGQTTRARVSQVAQALGYAIPKRTATTTAKITHLGLLNPPMHGGLMTSPFYHDVFLGVEQICQEQNINLSYNTLDMADIAQKRLRSYPSLLNEINLNGLVLVGALQTEIVSAIADITPQPLILVDNYLPADRWDSVMIDNICGMEKAVQYLVDQGHRHIALINGPDRPSIVERRQGYQNVMARHGLTPLMVTPPDLMPETVDDYVRQILGQAPQVTAFACSNDMQAIGVVKKLQDLGYSIPADFSITGFDDISLAQYTSPPLTTVRVDRIALGRIAAETLLGRIQDSDRPTTKTILNVCLVERGSVQAPRTEPLLVVTA